MEGLASAGWTIPSPKATMFAWAPIPEEFKEMGSMEFAKLLLTHAKVSVSPGVGFGEYGEGYVAYRARGKRTTRIRQAIRNIKKFMSEKDKHIQAWRAKSG